MLSSTWAWNTVPSIGDPGVPGGDPRLVGAWRLWCGVWAVAMPAIAASDEAARTKIDANAVTGKLLR